MTPYFKVLTFQLRVSLLRVIIEETRMGNKQGKTFQDEYPMPASM